MLPFPRYVSATSRLQSRPMHAAASPLTELTHIALSLDALNCGAMLVGRNGIIAHVNPRLCDMLGRRRDELIGFDVISLYPAGDDSVAAIRAMLDDFARSREAEFFLPLANGKRMPVIFSARPVGQNSVLSEYAVVTLIDIAQQKLAEERLREQTDE